MLKICNEFTQVNKQVIISKEKLNINIDIDWILNIAKEDTDEAIKLLANEKRASFIEYTRLSIEAKKENPKFYHKILKQTVRLTKQ